MSTLRARRRQPLTHARHYHTYTQEGTRSRAPHNQPSVVGDSLSRGLVQALLDFVEPSADGRFPPPDMCLSHGSKVKATSKCSNRTRERLPACRDLNVTYLEQYHGAPHMDPDRYMGDRHGYSNSEEHYWAVLKDAAAADLVLLNIGSHYAANNGGEARFRRLVPLTHYT